MATMTPCKNICTMDDNNSFCIGCYRTKNEINNWWSYSNDRKIMLMEELRNRSSEMRSIGYYGNNKD